MARKKSRGKGAAAPAQVGGCHCWYFCQMLQRKDKVLLPEGLFGGKPGVFTSSSFLLSFVEHPVIGHH